MPPPENPSFERAQARDRNRRTEGQAGEVLGRGGDAQPRNRQLGRGGEVLGWGADGPAGASADGPDGPARVRRSRSAQEAAPGMPPPAASTPSPYSAPATWDTLTIHNVLFLGVVTIDGDTGNALDVKHAKGRDGGRITDSGAEAAEFTITFRWWDEVTWASWCQVFAAIDPQRQVDRRNPLDVSHPALAQRGITRLYVKSVSFPKQGREGWTATAKVIQWIPSLTAPRTGRSVTRTPQGPDVASNRTAFSGLEDAPENQPDDPAETDTGP
jgi:hypothetical protein